ncbi:sigma 54-interacting transcriptional regulator [Xylocopilactobacillus apis]|uniref:sigma 54-interacting transcriptional regulator n=1 Tax=Xylocopilactobacillus apis TaxID=2932183 RepID=UPI0029546DB1|nr:sigma 54-interacting transcriptional regulator [Xylocopilactobacillus apis]
MSTVEQIEQTIKSNFTPDQRFTAQEIVKITKLSRSMVSGYLNQLFKQGSLDKENTRPTQFWLPDKEQVFNEIVGFDGSLAQIIEQCKAAVNYPPDGLPVIIRGNSGVGKSLLAKKIYQYAAAQRVIEPDAPFVTLNCADYANNPELLSSVLFGYVKGAFTGANNDKTGLLDAANGGYLFLDEVHNLTQENQEKLFLLIDQKKFHRLGEDEKWHQASIRLVLATTEDTKAALLATFRRRIPLEVTLPDFKDRTHHEKLQLVWYFFQKEAKQINTPLSVDAHFIEKLIEGSYEGNVGALQNKIKLSCAQAYSQQSSESMVYVPTTGLSEYFNISFRQSDRFNSLSEDKIAKILEQNFSVLSVEETVKHLNRFLTSIKPYCLTDDLGYKIILNNLQHGMDELSFYGLEFSDQNLNDISLLINLLSDYHQPVKINLDQRHLFKYFQIVNEILDLTHQSRADELLILFLIAYFKANLPIVTKRHALIIMHGKNSATSLASEANQLIGDYSFSSIDMPIQVKTQEIVKKVNEYVEQVDTKEGLILLVDMGSLEKMYTEIKDNVQGDFLILNNISTALALEVGFALKQNQPMEYFTKLDYSQFSVQSQYFEGIAQTQNIVISCMSGQGVAEKIQEIFTKFKSNNPVEILTLDYDKLQKLKNLHHQSTFKNTYCIIATSQITIPGVECINIERVVNGTQSLSCLNNLYSDQQLEQFTNELIKLFTIEGASSRLQFLNPDKVINEISEIITALENQYHVVFKNFIRVNLYLHLSSMIERILTGDTEDERVNTKGKEFNLFVKSSEIIFRPIKSKYNIKIPLREYEYVYQIIETQINN